MKVLWFSNTSALGEEYLNNKSLGGGWMKSLDKSIQEDVELHVAFYYPYKIESFKHRKSHYYPIYSGNILLNAFKRKCLNAEIDREDLSQYLDIINTVNPDIIHIHGTENSFGCIIREINIPVVVSIQGNITVCAHKFCSGIEAKFLNYLASIPKSLKSLLLSDFTFKPNYDRYIKKQKIEERNFFDCEHVIGRTDWDRRITRIQAPNRNYYYVSEILRDSFYNTKWEKSQNKKIIVNTTNGNSFFKGFETLCYALTLLNRIGVDVEWRVAGIKATDGIVNIVKKKLGENYPQKGLKLLGSLSELELVNSLLEADMYVMTSHIENSPNNLCEAMILGMPCIATMAGGTASILFDKSEGVLIQDGDPWVMAGAILEYVNDPEQAIKYGQVARKIALERHDKSKVVAQLMDTYNKILE